MILRRGRRDVAVRSKSIYPRTSKRVRDYPPLQDLKPAYIEEMIANNEFAEVKPPFVPGGAWTTPEGELWVQRSVPSGSLTTYDVFDDQATRVKQIVLPQGRLLLGFGRGVLYAVVEDEDGLQWVEKFSRR